MIRSFRHIGIVVSDIERSVHLFATIFNFKIISDQIESGKFIETLIGKKGCYLRVVKMADMSENVIELIHSANGNKKSSDITTLSLGLTHIAMNVTGIQRIVRELEKNSCHALSQPMINENKSHIVCYVKSFDNLFIELVEELQR